MNKFIKEAVTEKLMLLNEEKEALDSTISSYREKLIEMEKKQQEFKLIIDETVQFLKAKPNVKAARSKKR